MTDHARRRDNLMKQDAHCWYCAAPVTRYEPGSYKDTPPNMATVEHLFSKTVRRQQGIAPRDNEFPRDKAIVLACHDCNQLTSFFDVCIGRTPARELWDWYYEYTGKKRRPRPDKPFGPPALDRLLALVHEEDPGNPDHDPGSGRWPRSSGVRSTSSVHP